LAQLVPCKHLSPHIRGQCNKEITNACHRLHLSLDLLRPLLLVVALLLCSRRLAINSVTMSTTRKQGTHHQGQRPFC
jgi:hypothetical protein